jgi:hypothetical protein
MAHDNGEAICEEARNHPIFQLRRPIEQFIEKDLPRGSTQRTVFDRICADGSNPRLLWALFSVAKAEAKHSALDVLTSSRWSRSQFKKLPRELDSLAANIESLTKSEFFINLLTLCWKSSARSQFSTETLLLNVQRHLNTYQAVLPLLLKDLGNTMRSADGLITENFGSKRFDTQRHFRVRLLAYVRKSTGNPHWADVGCLLDVDPDSLKKLWRRTAKYGLLPKGSK